MSQSLFIGKQIIEFESLDSTNVFASQLLDKSVLEEGTAIVAKFQFRGQGYSGNIWQSEAGKNLLLSVILYPSFLSLRHQFFLNQISSLAVANTIESFLLNVAVKIKWPNDIIADGKKIAGILIENSVQGETIHHSIIGVGVNVNQNKLGATLLHATSFITIIGKTYSLEEVMRELFSQLERRYLQLRDQRIDLIQKDYMKSLYRIEEPSWFISNGQKFKGKIVGITSEGKLIIETSGKHEVFGFKEVEMLFD